MKTNNQNLINDVRQCVEQAYLLANNNQNIRQKERLYVMKSFREINTFQNLFGVYNSKYTNRDNSQGFRGQSPKVLLLISSN